METLQLLGSDAVRGERLSEDLGISLRTLVRLAKKGLFPKPVRIGNAFIWPRASLDEFFRSQLGTAGAREVKADAHQ